MGTDMYNRLICMNPEWSDTKISFDFPRDYRLFSKVFGIRSDSPGIIPLRGIFDKCPKSVRDLIDFSRITWVDWRDLKKLDTVPEAFEFLSIVEPCFKAYFEPVLILWWD